MIEKMIEELTDLADEWDRQAREIRRKTGDSALWGKNDFHDRGRMEALRKNAETIREYARGLKFQLDSTEKAPEGEVGPGELFLWEQQAIRVIMEEGVGMPIQLAARNRVLIEALKKERAQ